MIYNAYANYYMIDELCNTIPGTIAINDSNQAYVVAEKARWADLSDASDTANILKLEGLPRPITVASEPYEDIDEFEYDKEGHAFYRSNSDSLSLMTTHFIFTLGLNYMAPRYYAGFSLRRIYYQP